MLARLLKKPHGSFLLLGPSGTGKTTWLAWPIADAHGYDLLRTSESLRLNRNPSLFSDECSQLSAKQWVVVDEIQKVPQLLGEVQHLMTAKKLRFALSGSSARKLRRGGANLLAGRVEVRVDRDRRRGRLAFCWGRTPGRISRVADDALQCACFSSRIRSLLDWN